MKITFLGTGTSHGIPVIGCGCTVCRSADSRDQRMRASLFVEGNGGESVVIDTGPEFRLQAVRAGIQRLDAVLVSHAHADHVHGLDDVRPLCGENPLPVYGNPRAVDELRERFSYIFRETQNGGGKPRICLFPVTQPLRIGALEIRPIPVKHGELEIYGWHIAEKGKSLAYITDASGISAEAGKSIRGADLLILGALRARPHPTHFSFDEAIDFSLGTGIGSVYFTHFCHNHSHTEIEQYCLQALKDKKSENISIKPSFDGFSINL